MDAVAQALADPIRRDILRTLGRGTQTAGDLADAFPVSRPAVSRHLRVLRESGLIRDTVRGRHREYELVPTALDELEAFIHTLRTPAVDWDRRFAALETEVFRVRNQRRRSEATTVAKPSTKKKESA